MSICPVCGGSGKKLLRLKPFETHKCFCCFGVGTDIFNAPIGPETVSVHSIPST